METRKAVPEKFRGGMLAMLFAAALLLAPGVSAQYSAPKQQPQQPPPPAAQTAKPGDTSAPATPPVNKEEEDAAAAVLAMPVQNSAPAIQAGEDFLQKYPNSRHRGNIYARLVHEYLNAGKEDKVMATGDKALVEDPDNVDVLAFMSWFLGHRHHPNALDAEQRLLSVNQYGHRALLLIAGMQKPEGVSDEVFARAKNEKEGLSHSGLGLFYFWEGKTTEMIDELTQSTAIDPTPDPVDFFLLAEGHAKLKKYADAVSGYDRCSQMTWAWQDRCKTKLAQAKALAAAQPATAPAPAAAPAVAPAAAPATPAPTAEPAKPKPPIS